MEDRVEEKIDKLLTGFYNFEKRTGENFKKLNKEELTKSCSQFNFFSGFN